MAGIRVRMYRVGFGDCFLVTLTDDARQSHHILVDCGVHHLGKAGTMDQVVDDIQRETGSRLALVVATHSHEDHISGFGSNASQFNQIRAREVWMPWVEDPSDAQAQSYRKQEQAMLLHLESHAALWANDERENAARAALLNLRGNAKAMDTLRRGFGGAQVRYLQATDRPIDNAAGIPGLKVTVLGPPRDEAFLTAEDPPSDDRFFRAAGSSPAGDGRAATPFAEHYRHKADRDLDGYVTEPDKTLVKDILDDDVFLAFRLEKKKNNTSLVLLLEFAGHRLLFPGDAQYGSWDSWRNRPDR
ncbi:MAG: MBL fold metallo-hydrolase, partial [Actinomycetota bacterium]